MRSISVQGCKIEKSNVSAALNRLGSHHKVDVVGNLHARALYSQAKQDRVEQQFANFAPPPPGATGVTYNGGRKLTAFLTSARTTEFQRGYTANFLYNVQHDHD
jgi:hypothetical protein